MKRLATILVISLMGLVLVQAQSTKVLLKTTAGDITLVLYDDTPLHKENFIDLVKDKFYDGMLFHRVMNNFMIQTGDPGSKTAQAGQMLGTGGPGYTVPAEFKKEHIHKKGAVAAARLGGPQNPRKESNGSQFYIVHGKKWTAEELDMMVQRGRPEFSPEERRIYMEEGGYAFLDFEYTVFGEVVKGIEIVDAIAAVPVDQHNRPIDDVKIIEAKIIK